MKKQLLLLSIMLLGATICQGMQDEKWKGIEDPEWKEHFERVKREEEKRNINQAFWDYYRCRVRSKDDAWRDYGNRPYYENSKTLGYLQCELALRQALNQPEKINKIRQLSTKVCLECPLSWETQRQAEREWDIQNELNIYRNKYKNDADWVEPDYY